MNIDWGNVGSFIAVAIAVITIYITWKKYPHEVKNIETDAADKVTDAALKLLEPMQKRITDLEKEKTAMEKDLKATIKELDYRVRELEKQLKIVEDAFSTEISGSKKLYHQIISLGGNPVYKPSGIEKDST